MIGKIKEKFFSAGNVEQKNDPIEDKFLRAVNILANEYALKKSMKEGNCIDKEGRPIPWYTYPAIEYLKQLDFSDKRIFEFGSGNSSLYWSGVAKEIVTVENDKEWYDSRLGQKKENMKMLYRELGEGYHKSIEEENGSFDVVVIDGRLRDKCCESAIKKVAPDGLIILDNSERVGKEDEYKRAIGILKNANLIQVDFCGFGPLNDYTWSTSFFFSRSFDFKSINHPIQPVDIIGQI